MTYGNDNSVCLAAGNKTFEKSHLQSNFTLAGWKSPLCKEMELDHVVPDATTAGLSITV